MDFETTGGVMLAAGFNGIYMLLGLMLVMVGLRLSGRLSPLRFGSVWGWMALAMLATGLFLSLAWAPADRDMGDVARIMYVHFPSWIGAGATYGVALVASFFYLAKRHPNYDYWAAAGVEAGLAFTALGLVTGSIWGRPTWGIWWTWDPRLTSTAIMFIAFIGYMALRAFIEEPDTRARFSAVVAIVAFINLPIVYMSVRWWRTLHQPQSSPETMDPEMVLALRVMMVAFMLLAGWMMSRRFELERLRGDAERSTWEMEGVQ